MHACVFIFMCGMLVLWVSCDSSGAGQKEVNATGRSFTVRSSVHLKVDRKDDGAAYTCVVDHIALGSMPYQVTEVLEVHCKSSCYRCFTAGCELHHP